MVEDFGTLDVIIDSPPNGSKVKHQVPIKGRITKKLPEKMELWIVKDVNNRYHPDDGPIDIIGETWESFAYVGNNAPRSDQGVHFTIHIVEVSHETGKKFDAYLTGAKQTGNWPGINRTQIVLVTEKDLENVAKYDGIIKKTITVIRNDPKPGIWGGLKRIFGGN